MTVHLDERWQVGQQMVTTKCNGVAKDDWHREALQARTWGMPCVIKHVSDRHGLCYGVTHSDGTTGWYEHDEIEPFVSPLTKMIADKIAVLKDVKGAADDWEWQRAQGGIQALEDLQESIDELCMGS